MYKAASSPSSPIRNGTSRGGAVDAEALLRETIRCAVKDEVEDDKKVNNQRNQLTKRRIIILSVALAVFGLLCVGAGACIAYLSYWIHFDSGMSKYIQVK